MNECSHGKDNKWVARSTHSDWNTSKMRLSECAICRWLPQSSIIARWSVSAWDRTMRMSRHNVHVLGDERWLTGRFICNGVELLKYDGILKARVRGAVRKSISVPHLQIFDRKKQEALTCSENWANTKLGCRSFGRWISPSSRRLCCSVGTVSWECHQTAVEIIFEEYCNDEESCPPLMGIGWLP